jgi:hypothetical protein
MNEGVVTDLPANCRGPSAAHPGGALTASMQAAAEAEAVLAPAEALRHLEQALVLWQQVPKPAAVGGSDRVELVLRAAEVAAGSGRSSGRSPLFDR